MLIDVIILHLGIVKRYGNYHYSAQVPPEHKATAYCKPVYIDRNTHKDYITNAIQYNIMYPVADLNAMKLNLVAKVTKRIARKKGQHQNSPSHSDLYTDENPKGTIHGLKFATVQDAKDSVKKIENSGKSHAHKIQAAIAMEQRARVMGKTTTEVRYLSCIYRKDEKDYQTEK